VPAWRIPQSRSHSSRLAPPERRIRFEPECRRSCTQQQSDTAASRHIGTIRLQRALTPAFVLRRQHHEDKEHGGAEDKDGRISRLFLFVGKVGPFKSDALRKPLRANPSIAASAVPLEARSRAALYLGRRKWLCGAADMVRGVVKRATDRPGTIWPRRCASERVMSAASYESGRQPAQ